MITQFADSSNAFNSRTHTTTTKHQSKSWFPRVGPWIAANNKLSVCLCIHFRGRWGWMANQRYLRWVRHRRIRKRMLEAAHWISPHSLVYYDPFCFLLELTHFCVAISSGVSHTNQTRFVFFKSHFHLVWCSFLWNWFNIGFK